MSSNSEAGLHQRWLENPERIESALALLKRGLAHANLPFGTISGRADLRGLIIPRNSPKPMGYVVDGSAPDAVVSMITTIEGIHHIENVKLMEIDLSAAEVANLRLRDVEFRDCVFDRGSLYGWRAWATVWLDCTFQEVKFDDSNLGIWWHGKRSVFVNCSFAGARMNDLDFKHARFENCNFGPVVDLSRTHFSDCLFEDCIFDGSLEETIFTRCELGVADFSEANMRWTEFRETSLEHVVAPRSDAEHVVVHNYWSVVTMALERLSTESDDDYRPLYHRLRVGANNADESRRLGVWHITELGATESQQAKARVLLEELDSAIGE